MKEYVGKCQYCGDEMTVIASSQMEANDMAAEKCGCDGAHIQEKKNQLRQNLDDIIGNGAAQIGLFAPCEEVVQDAIQTIGAMIIERRLMSASFRVDGTVITITNSGTKTKVKRKKTYESGGEIE